MVYFTSDLHIGHKAIFKYRTKFSTSKQHHRYMIDKIIELGKRDVLYSLGDFLFDDKGDHSFQQVFDEIQERAKCRIKIVMGNHDSLKLYEKCSIHVKPSENRFEMQLPLFCYKNNWVSHCPIHPQEFRKRKLNIHGHLHLENINDERYFNVNIDQNNYEFVEFSEISKRIKNED
jgi:calcineurin-like phosphoesterase family protein